MDHDGALPWLLTLTSSKADPAGAHVSWLVCMQGGLAPQVSTDTRGRGLTNMAGDMQVGSWAGYCREGGPWHSTIHHTVFFSPWMLPANHGTVNILIGAKCMPVHNAVSGDCRGASDQGGGG
jgi:hypothetical protein